MGGYAVGSQTFGLIDRIDKSLLSGPVDGIMGLSWQALSRTKAVPWWTTLAQSGAWSQPLFGFYLARWRDKAGASSLETEGGFATFGYLDSNLYSGSITYVPVASNAQYWQIPMDKMTMQGSNVNFGSSNMVAIDTGTTLIGGSASAIAAIFAAIPGSSPMGGGFKQYYQYPCSTKIDFQITFGGFTIKITDADFNLGRFSADSSMCTGAAFITEFPSWGPVQWIIGDTLLKNTYSVFRYSPAAVGFAALAGAGASTANSASTTIPIASLATDGFTMPLSDGSSASPTGASGNSSASGGSASATGSASLTGSASGGSALASPTSIASARVIVATQTVTAADGSAAAANASAAGASATSKTSGSFRQTSATGSGALSAALIGLVGLALGVCLT